MLVKMQCSNCGAQLEVDNNCDVFFCKHCGTKMVNLAEKIEISHKITDANADNVSIVFSSLRPELRITSSVTDTGRQDVLTHGDTIGFRLNVGWHEIVFTYGGWSQKETIYIREDNALVKISVSFTGRWNVSVSQPIIPVEANEQRENELRMAAENRIIQEQAHRAELAALREKNRRNRAGVVATVFSSISLLLLLIINATLRYSDSSGLFLFTCFFLVPLAAIFLLTALILALVSIKSIVKKVRGWGATIAAGVLIIISVLMAFSAVNEYNQYESKRFDFLSEYDLDSNVY